MQMFSQVVSDKGEWLEKSEDCIRLKGLRRYLGSIKSWSREVLIFCCFGSVRSICYFSCNRLLRGLADERLVDADSNSWDNNSAPKADWDAIVDGCKRGIELEVKYYLKREDKLIFLSNWWFCSAKSLPSGGFLSYTLGCLTFWRLICEYC